MCINASEMSDFCGTILKILEENKKSWEKIYGNYAKLISKNIPKIKDLRRLFNEWKPLYYYMSIAEAKSTACNFDVRFLGQSVAKLTIKKTSIVLSTERQAKSNEEFYKFKTILKDVDWNSDDAKMFRQYFQRCGVQQNFVPRQLEHKYESMILSEMLDKDKKSNKFLGSFKNVNAFAIGDVCRCQMCTPLRASVPGNIRYGENGSGGGIDILARIGRGQALLSVFELKQGKNIPLAPVIKQGLAYTVFLRELLRSKSGKEWYKIFGYKSDIPKKLKLNCIALMDYENEIKNFQSFKTTIGSDFVNVHYMLYRECNGRIEITERSLPCE